MLTYKQIEASREVRLWIGQIIVPAVGVALAIPESREWIANKAREVKWKMQSWKYKKSP